MVGKGQELQSILGCLSGLVRNRDIALGLVVVPLPGRAAVGRVVIMHMQITGQPDAGRDLGRHRREAGQYRLGCIHLHSTSLLAMASPLPTIKGGATCGHCDEADCVSA
jgi:hypothetical protein